MRPPSTAVGCFPLPEEESSKLVSDVNTAMSSATGMWMTQTKGLGIAWAGAGKKQDRIKQKSRSLGSSFASPP